MVNRLWECECIKILSGTSDNIPNSSSQCQNLLSHIPQSLERMKQAKQRPKGTKIHSKGILKKLFPSGEITEHIPRI